MSHVATGIVQRRKVGSPTRKAVLMFMAACASDDGTGIWTSKQNMADDLEMGKRTVQVCIDDLAADGLISEVGRRSCRNGFTVEYRINLEAVQALESTREDSPTRAAPAPQGTHAPAAPVQDVHVTRAAPAPQDVQHLHPNLTGTILEPSEEAKASLSSGDDAKKRAAAEISDALSQYNLAAAQSGWPEVKVLSQARKSSLAARLRECGGISGWASALSKAQESPHCNGQNDRGWVANFDFLIRQSSFAKLMEGNYDKRPSPTAQSSTGQPGSRGPHNSMVAGFAEVAARGRGVAQ